MAAVALAVFLPVIWILLASGERLLRAAGLERDRAVESPGFRRTGEWPVWGGRAVRLFAVGERRP